MPNRKLHPESASVSTLLRMAEEMRDWLDAEAARLNQVEPAKRWSRAAVIRAAVERYRQDRQAQGR